MDKCIDRRLHPEHRKGTEHRAQVYPLVIATEVHCFQQFPVPFPERRAFELSQMQGRSGRRGSRFEYGAGLRQALPYHHRHSGLDYAGLLRGDLSEGIAQYVAVVVAYVGDYAQLWRNDVGAVQATSQATFDDGHVHPLVGEPAEGH